MALPSHRGVCPDPDRGLGNAGCRRRALLGAGRLTQKADRVLEKGWGTVGEGARDYRRLGSSAPVPGTNRGQIPPEQNEGRGRLCPATVSSWATHSCSNPGTSPLVSRSLPQERRPSIRRPCLGPPLQGLTTQTRSAPWAGKGVVPTETEEPRDQGPSSHLTS